MSLPRVCPCHLRAGTAAARPPLLSRGLGYSGAEVGRGSCSTLGFGTLAPWRAVEAGVGLVLTVRGLWAPDSP